MHVINAKCSSDHRTQSKLHLSVTYPLRKSCRNNDHQTPGSIGNHWAMLYCQQLMEETASFKSLSWPSAHLHDKWQEVFHAEQILPIPQMLEKLGSNNLCFLELLWSCSYSEWDRRHHSFNELPSLMNWLVTCCLWNLGGNDFWNCLE